MAVHFFNRIYLDSEPLTASGWPRVSVTLKSLLSVATGPLPFSLYLPDAVQMEQEAQFLRDYSKVIAALSKAPRALNAFRARIGEADFEIALPPSIDVVLGQYRARIQAAREQWQLQPVPLTGRPTTEVFQLLLERQKPFEEDGSGLGDALIYLSVVDHLHQSPEAAGVLVTADGHFKGAQALADASGVRLAALSLDETIAAIRERFTAAVRAFVQSIEAQAKEAVENNREMLTAYLTANVEIPPFAFTSLGETLVSPTGIEILAIERVQVTPVLPATDQQASLSMRLRALLRLKVEVAIHPPMPPLKIGQTSADQQEELVRAYLLEALGDQPVVKREIRDKEVKVSVEVEATAQREAAGFANLTWTAARLVDSSGALTGLRSLLP